MLDDKERFVRTYAATALLLMNDTRHAEKILRVVYDELASKGMESVDRSDLTSYFKSRIGLDPLVEERWAALAARANAAWHGLHTTSLSNIGKRQ